MTKERLRSHGEGFRARDIPDSVVTIGKTGGTTGAPMRIPRDAQTGDCGSACYLRGLAWGGLTIREKRVRLFGGSLGIGKPRPFDGVRHWLAGETILPAFEMGPDNVREYAERIRRSGARFLIGYSSACYLLASLVEQFSLGVTFSAVYPTAELLPDEWEETIARVLKAKVLPYYGCGELNSLGYTCPEATTAGPVYHTCDEHAVIEVEDDAGEARLEGEGAFLITDLDNFATPIIRYRNGDAGCLAGPGCDCGRTLGRILRLDGRVNDVLVTTTGSRFSGVIATHAFRQIENVECYQIVQRAPGEATIRVVRAGGYDPSIEEPKMRRIFGEHLGEGSRVAIEYVQEIARTPAGKARFVINEMAAAEAGAHRSGAAQ
jgi:phenylacetate-CoA ligase